MLVPFDGPLSLRASYLNSLKVLDSRIDDHQSSTTTSKEAAFICRGSAARVMEMGTVAQEQLWGAVQGGAPDMRALCEVVDSLQLAPIARGGRQATVPLRVYINARPQGAFPSYAGMRHTSRPWEVELESQAVTLGDVVTGVLQSLPDTGSAGGTGSEPPSPRSSQGRAASECRVLVGGVEPPLETPLAWLHQHMRCLDQFLYVTVLV